MRDPLMNYEPGLNFWHVLPQLIDVQPFATLYNKDKTEGKTDSSKMMWWVVRVHHVSPFNTLRNTALDQRQRSMSTTYFDDEKWHQKKGEKLEPLITMWEMIGKSDLQREVEMMREGLGRRRTFFSTLSYTATNMKDADMAMLNGKKLLADLKELEAQLTGEALKEKGDSKASAAEQHLI